MNPTSVDCMRALSSIAASETMDPELRDKAKFLLKEYMAIIEASQSVEKKQIQRFANEMSDIKL